MKIDDISLISNFVFPLREFEIEEMHSFEQCVFHNQTIYVYPASNEELSSGTIVENFLYTFKEGAFPVKPHKHLTMDEYFKVIEGEMKFTLKDREFIANAKTGVIYIPIEAIHGFEHHGKEPARMLVQTVGDVMFSKYLQELSDLLDNNVTDLEREKRSLKIRLKYGIE